MQRDLANTLNNRAIVAERAGRLTFRFRHRVDALSVTGLGSPVLPDVCTVQVNYRLPVPYPSEIEIELFADRIGSTSITIGHRVVSADGKSLHADGHVVMVWVDRATGTPAPLPDAVREVAAGIT